MKVSALQLTMFLAMAAASIRSATAFVVPQQQRQQQRRNMLVLRNSAETKTSTDEYNAVKTQFLQGLKGQLSEMMSGTTTGDSSGGDGAAPAPAPDVDSQAKLEALMQALAHFCNEYFGANQEAYESKSSNDKSKAIVAPQLAAQRFGNALTYGMKYGMGPNKYTFGVSHKAIRGGKATKDQDDDKTAGVDFYKFGCDFFRPCMDLDHSVLLGEENLRQAFGYIQSGENVVFLANHQSEADPQVLSVMMEQTGMGQEAQEVYFVAGHKVTTDALAIPFSMGRNLICIHSKKHIDSGGNPAEKSRKQKQNLQAMGKMLELLRNGGMAFERGTALWVAPSGGRDRRNVETGEVPLAPFDQKTVDMFRLMGNKSKVRTHFYSMAMVSYELCPPPDFIDPGVGETRNIRYSPVGICVSEELPNVGGVDSRHLFSENAMATCEADYKRLLKAMEEKMKKD